jgi:hypothetical protein
MPGKNLHHVTLHYLRGDYVASRLRQKGPVANTPRYSEATEHVTEASGAELIQPM